MNAVVAGKAGGQGNLPQGDAKAIRLSGQGARLALWVTSKAKEVYTKLWLVSVEGRYDVHREVAEELFPGMEDKLLPAAEEYHYTDTCDEIVKAMSKLLKGFTVVSSMGKWIDELHMYLTSIMKMNEQHLEVITEEIPETSANTELNPFSYFDESMEEYESEEDSEY